MTKNYGALTISFAALACSGCATIPQQAPAPQVVTKVERVEIKVPVIVPCVLARDIPNPPATYMNPQTQNTEKLAAAARLDLLELEAYIVRADSLLRGCVKELEAIK